MKYGVCCIVLGLEEEQNIKFNKITYAKFSKLNRDEAVTVLSGRILNNIRTTFEAIKFCHSKGYCYRLSSDLFPLITYDKANVCLEELPDYSILCGLFEDIKSYLSTNPVRVSCHPSEFNVLASKNKDAVDRTIRELNFYSDFMDKIGCPSDYNSPINLHVNNNDGDCNEVIARFSDNFAKLNKSCQNRLVIENDDKPKCWSVRKLIDFYFSKTGRPITFDYLHHKCHPDGYTEEEAIKLCHQTWGEYRPLFHLSESKDDKQIRAHSDYPTQEPNTYGLDFDLDFEFKMKDKAIAFFEKEIKCKQLVNS